MKNLLAKKSLSEQFAEGVGEITKWTIIAIIAFLFLIAKLIKKFAKEELKLLLIVLLLVNCYTTLLSRAYAPKPVYAINGFAPITKPVTERDEIINYIHEVFGKDAERAFKLLTNPACHENGALNPTATNTNSDGSTDYGLFQINSYWNGFNKPVNNERFLFDWKLNTLIAYDIFKSNHNTFDRWTCGKGI